MIIECPECQAKYQYSEDRFDGKPSKKIRCAKCQVIFEVKNPAAPPEPEAAAPAKRAPKAPAEDEFDSTASRKKPSAPSTEHEQTHIGGPRSATTGKADGAPKLSGDRRYSLAVLDGPDAGKVHRVEQSKVVIGRSGADINLDDIEASRHHAALEIRDPVVLLYDLESTNGTFVDGEKISRPVELTSHSEFTIGMTTLMLIVTEDG